MSANVAGLIRQGIAALKSGNRDEARRLLNQAAELDSRSEEAWLWLSACVDSLENQQICLENVLAINPTNERARKGLDKIRKQLAEQKKPPVQTALPPAAALFDAPSGAPAAGRDPFAPPAGMPFGAAPPDPYGARPAPSMPPSPPPFTDDSFDDLAFDELPPESAALPGYHGSGSTVEEPSATDLDDWVDSLNLGRVAPPAKAMDDSFGAGPFQSPSFSSGLFDDNPFSVKEDFGFDVPAAPPPPPPPPADNFPKLTSPGPDSSDYHQYHDSFGEQAAPYAQPASFGQADSYAGTGYEMDDEAALYGDSGLFDDQTASEFEEASELMKYFDYLPAGIAATHLPGKAPVYPRGTLLGLALVTLGSVAALAVLVLQLLT